MRQRRSDKKRGLRIRLAPKKKLPRITPKRPIALLISYTLFVSSLVLLLMIGTVLFMPQQPGSTPAITPKPPLQLGKTVSERKQPAPLRKADSPELKAEFSTATANITPNFESGSDKIAYLTFDDGPNPAYTPLILEILKLNNIKATFFIVGRKAEAEPELVRAVAAEGHIIGNHTYEHDYNITRSWSTLERSIIHTQGAIESICGVRPTLFRPPGGTTFVNRSNRDKIERLGFRIVLWDITTGDGSTQTTPAQMIELVNSQLSKDQSNRARVILMHDDRPASVIALQQIITLLIENGYSFSTID